MSNYTALNLTVLLRQDVPADVMSFLHDILDMDKHMEWCRSVPSAYADGDHHPAIPAVNNLPEVTSGDVRVTLHPFFQTPRWDDLLTPTGGPGRAFKDIDGACSTLEKLPTGGAVLRLMSSLKNYDDEIDLFLEWLSPFVVPLPEGTQVGVVFSSDSESMTDVAWSGGALERTNWRDYEEDFIQPWPLTMALPSRAVELSAPALSDHMFVVYREPGPFDIPDPSADFVGAEYFGIESGYDQAAQAAIGGLAVGSTWTDPDLGVCHSVTRVPAKFPSIGARITLRDDADWSPDFEVPKGAKGTVVVANDEMISVKLDEHVDGAENWDNCIQWYPTNNPGSLAGFWQLAEVEGQMQDVPDPSS